MLDYSFKSFNLTRHKTFNAECFHRAIEWTRAGRCLGVTSVTCEKKNRAPVGEVEVWLMEDERPLEDALNGYSMNLSFNRKTQNRRMSVFGTPKAKGDSKCSSLSPQDRVRRQAERCAQCIHLEH